MQKWEYTSMYWHGSDIWVGCQVVTRDKKASPLTYMQQLGEEGWEMVGAVSETMCFGAYFKDEWGGIRWYFKRPKS
jgi:hypothetical protein